MKTRIQVAVLLLLSWGKGLGQGVIRLQNPSFEDTSRACKPPVGWYDCGAFYETPVDIQPGFHTVELEPYDGETYLGMVVRDNNTWEAVSQRLSESLRKDSVYEMRIFLARSESFLAASRSNSDITDYTTPVVFRLWGGTKLCDRLELFAVSPPVENTEWQEYILEFTPKKYNRYDYITLEAHYQTTTRFSYNGNLMLDNCLLIKKQEDEK